MLTGVARTVQANEQVKHRLYALVMIQYYMIRQTSPFLPIIMNGRKFMAQTPTVFSENNI